MAARKRPREAGSLPVPRADARVTRRTRQLLLAVRRKRQLLLAVRRKQQLPLAVRDDGGDESKAGAAAPSFAEALLARVLPYVVDDPVPTVRGPVFGIPLGCKLHCLYPCVALYASGECCTVLGRSEEHTSEL